MACSIRRRDQPSRPKAIICCRLSSLNTLLMAPEATVPPSDVNVPGDYFSLAGFDVTMYGRFWVTPEVRFKTFSSLSRLSLALKRKCRGPRVGPQNQ